MVVQDFTVKTKELIDNLKGVCTSYGLGNDGNEFKIITQVFLFKFMNDKFGYDVKQIDEKLKNAENWEVEIRKYSDDAYEMLLLQLNADSAKLKREHFLSNLFNNLLTLCLQIYLCTIKALLAVFPNYSKYFL